MQTRLAIASTITIFAFFTATACGPARATARKEASLAVPALANEKTTIPTNTTTDAAPPAPLPPQEIFAWNPPPQSSSLDGSMIIYGISPPSLSRSSAVSAAREALFREAASRLFGVLYSGQEQIEVHYTSSGQNVDVDRGYNRQAILKLRPLILRHIDQGEPVFDLENGKVVCSMRGTISAVSARKIIEENRSALLAARLLVAGKHLETSEEKIRVSEFSEAVTELRKAKSHIDVVHSVTESEAANNVGERVVRALEVARRLASGRRNITIIIEEDLPRKLRDRLLQKIQEQVGDNVMIEVKSETQVLPTIRRKAFADNLLSRVHGELKGSYTVKEEIPVFESEDAIVSIPRWHVERTLIQFVGDEPTGALNAHARLEAAIFSSPGEGSDLGRLTKNESISVVLQNGGYFVVRAERGSGWVYGTAIQSPVVRLVRVKKNTPVYDASGKWVKVVQPGEYVVQKNASRGVRIVLPDNTEGEVREFEIIK